MRDLTYRGLVDLFCDSIDEVVAKRGGSVETIIGRAASEAEIVAFEERLGITFPRDFKDFLTVCDGFQSTILGPKEDVASICHISGLAGIEREQETLRIFMEAVESASIEQADRPVYDSAIALSRYICFGHDGWLVFDNQSPPQDNARVIIGSFADVAWLTKPLQLAYSFREYFERSIATAIMYGTFDYDRMPFVLRIEDC